MPEAGRATRWAPTSFRPTKPVAGVPGPPPIAFDRRAAPANRRARPCVDALRRGILARPYRPSPTTWWAHASHWSFGFESMSESARRESPQSADGRPSITCHSRSHHRRYGDTRTRRYDRRSSARNWGRPESRAWRSSRCIGRALGSGPVRTSIRRQYYVGSWAPARGAHRWRSFEVRAAYFRVS